MRVGLVGCGAAKQATPAPAGELYTGSLFKLTSAYARKFCDRWYILSARYGLVPPDRVIAPYEQSLMTMPAKARANWSLWVSQQLAREVSPDDVLVLVAGKPYGGFISLVSNKVEIPCGKLRLAFRKVWLTQQLKGEGL